MYHYLPLAHTIKYILKDIFVLIIEEQCSDQEEYQRKRYQGCEINENDIPSQINGVHIVDTPVAK